MVEAGDLVGLEEAAAACRAAQVRSEELGAEIAKTARDIELAASDTSIALTAARLEAAVQELSAHREEAVRLATATFLLDAIESEHRSEAHRLRWHALLPCSNVSRAVSSSYASRARAVQTALAAADRPRLLGLDQLSTGTRAQLLIASRLAFALDCRGRRHGPGRGAGEAHATEHVRLGLPFFLDEALRLRSSALAAVAAAILEVAASKAGSSLPERSQRRCRLWHEPPPRMAALSEYSARQPRGRQCVFYCCQLTATAAAGLTGEVAATVAVAPRADRR